MVVDSDAEMWAAALARLEAEPERMSLRFQPIVDLKRGRVAGYEVLSRFVGPPEAGPDRWFKAAAARGVSCALDGLVVDEALSRRGDLPPNTFMTVNVGPESLVDSGFLARLEAHGSLGGVTIELTEHTSVDDYGPLLRVMASLRDRGATFAVDDAGAGYSSLQHILVIRPDFVKIDRVFIDRIDQDPAKGALVEAVGSLASKLDAWIIAEGIERPEELSELLRLGVPLAQGFFLARPSEAFEELSPSVAGILRFQGTRATDGATVRRLVEDANVVQGSAASRGPEGPDAFEVDDWGRPRGVRRADGGGREVMRVTADASPVDVLRRAMTRPAAQRFDPIACIDEEGRLLGVIRLDRLINATISRGEF